MKHGKNLLNLQLFLILLCCGCASSAAYRYSNDFNNALKKGEATALLSPLPFDELNENAIKELEQLGYERAVYVDKAQGFIVVVKNQNLIKSFILGNPMSHKILLKFTDWDNDQTRIDLVNAADALIAKPEVERDIKTFQENFVAKIAVAIDSKISGEPN